MFIELLIEPFAKQRPRSWNGRMLTPKKTRAWEKRAKMIMHSMRPELMTGALSVVIVFYFKRPKTVKREFHTVRPDIDNLQKSILDAANGILWEDDSQIISLKSDKVYTELDSKISISVRRVE